MPHLSGTHQIEGWVVFGGGGQSGWVQKIFLPPRVNPQNVQPLMSCYTDYAIPAHCFQILKIIWNCLHGYCVQYMKLSGGHKEATSHRCLPKRQRMKQQLMAPQSVTY
jgi:hypothetical protein